MGHNVERLGRLRDNRVNIGVIATNAYQAGQRTAVSAAVEATTADLQKVVKIEGFEGSLGELINAKITAIQTELNSFSQYQKKIGEIVDLANEALHGTAQGVASLPEMGLTASQQSTIDMAAQTGSPVQVSPGVTMTPGQARQYYAEQAEAEQEEAARQMTIALDKRLQELIDDMPKSEYDPDEPDDDALDGGGSGGTPRIENPGLSGGPGVTGPGGGSGGGSGGSYVGPGVTGPGGGGETEPPHHVVEPPTRQPPVRTPIVDGGGPHIDGGSEGTIPGGGSGGPRPTLGGGLTGPGGVGGTPPGGIVGGAVGGAGGAALAGGLARAGGITAVGAVGGVGGVGGVGAGAGGAGGPGAAGVVAQSGASSGARAGMVPGAGVAGGAEKRRRRRGQDLLAFDVDPEDDGAAPDLGAAGAAGSSASDGREDLGW